MVKIGFIGCGGISGAHGPRLKADKRVEAAAFCDIRQQAAQKLRTKMLGESSNAPIYEDYKQMIDNEELDAVLVLTPHCYHYEHAKYALIAGKHVLLEKPMCNGIDECRELISIAGEKGLVLAIGYQRHTGAEYMRAKRFIDQGGIGEIKAVSAFLTQDWQRGCEGKWRTDPAISGGGQLNDSGSHLQDVVLWLAGSSVKDVKAFVNNNGSRVDIYSSISARLENGVLINLVVSGGPNPWNEEISIWGSEGAIFYRNWKFTFQDSKGNPIDPGPMPAEYDPDTNFIDAVLMGTPVAATGYDGLRVQELTRSAYRSAETGQMVTLR